jgi:class 3 adenylate cyclase
MANKTDRPQVRFSLRWKIILPFIFLALVLALVATLFVNKLVVQAEAVRFLRQLRDCGQQAVDEVVRIEDRLLEIERAIAYTEGVAEAVALGNSEGLRDRIISTLINADVDVAVVLDRDGTSLLAARRSSPDAPEGDYLILRGEAIYAGWPFVQRILRLETAPDTQEVAELSKHAGMQVILLGEEEELVFFIGGPLVDEEGTIFGAVLAGEYMTNYLDGLSTYAHAHISLYDASSGELLETVFRPDATWQPSDLTLSAELIQSAKKVDLEESPYHTIQIAQKDYGEVLTPFVVKHGEEELGVLGISLLAGDDPESISENYQQDAWMIVRNGAIILLLVVLTGLLISNAITRPLIDMADASTQIATGNLDTQVIATGTDEIGVLARTFNRMVDGLRETAMYRDLLIRTVPLPMRERVHETLLRSRSALEGQTATATVLVANLLGFTQMAIEADPKDVIQTLDEYFGGVVHIITQHGGAIQTFDGDEVIAFFGVLPKSVPPQVSALQATHAAMEMIQFVDSMNQQRQAEGYPDLELRIGLATGPVIAGGIGAKDRLQFTIIGDTVENAKRIQRVAIRPRDGRLLISEGTYASLATAQSQFVFGHRGEITLRSEEQRLGFYEVRNRSTKLVDIPQGNEGE